jgi:serine protease
MRMQLTNNSMRRSFCSLATCVAAGFFCSPANAAQIYSNGPLSTGPNSKSGVAAPNGTTWSELQNDMGNMMEANTTIGTGATVGSNRLADDFTVPAGQVWRIEGIDFYAYLTNAPAMPSPFVSYTVQLWDNVPGAPGSVVIAGNTATNVLTSSTDALMFRIVNSQVPPPGTVPNTARRIWRNRVTFAAPIVLQPGTYWIDWDLDDNNPNAFAFNPHATVVGSRTQPGWNARQLTIANATWLPLVDTGNPVSAPDVAADMPFDLQGSACGDTIVDAPETCDDGNIVDDDGCDSNCTPTACGNGVHRLRQRRRHRRRDVR